MALVRRKNSLKLLLLFTAIFLVWYLSGLLHIDTVGTREYLKRLPILFSGPIFIALYVTVTFFIWFSKDIFRVIAAVVFGAYWSTLFVFVAECINAFILFYAARYLGRDFVEKSLHGRGSQLYDKISRANFLWLLVLRATPLLPFRFLDLGCGLTKMRFKRYFAAVLLGSPLRIFWLQFALAGTGGAVFNNPLVLSEYMAVNRPLFFLSLVYLALVVVVAAKMKDKKWR